MQAKTGATVTYRDGTLVADPATITAETVTVEPVQLTPASFAQKLKMPEMDLKTAEFNGVLANATAN